MDPNPRVIKGRTAIINCPVSSVPFPDITWKKAGQELIEDARVQIINNGLQLRIAYAEEADAAQYTCVASNPAGEVKLDFGLLVLGMSGEKASQVMASESYEWNQNKKEITTPFPWPLSPLLPHIAHESSFPELTRNKNGLVLFIDLFNFSL